MSDFSLMDAIECGIVKLPRVPVADNIPSGEMPTFRNLWEHIGTKMPRKGRAKSALLDPLSIPIRLKTALEALYGHYEKIFDQWRETGIQAPPCFIVVCNNTATSKLVYDYISGFHRQHEDGSSSLENGRLELFRNFDEYGHPLARPHTLLIDSEQLDSGEGLGRDFRVAASDEIERFRREIVARTGDRRQAESLSDQDLLREVMNTVGVAGRLGGSTRCVVSVSMLTEGWDARTVTHILGVRAFGTQLLCEQVVGRALRRQSYDLNEEGLFNVEYADVLGIPFDFTAQPVAARQPKPRETVPVRAITPDRDACEIRFPRVQGYRVELPEEHVDAKFGQDSTLVLTPDIVGPSVTHNAGIIGEGVDLNLIHRRDLRPATLVYHLTKTLLEKHWRAPDQEPKLHLFGQLKRVTRRWLTDHLVCKGGTYPAQLMYQELADQACTRITRGIVARHLGERPVTAVLDPYNPTGSTIHVNFTTSKQPRWQTDARLCHVNWVVCDSEWEAEFCRFVESQPQVRAYVKNHGLGLEVPYRYGSEARTYLPDFIVLVDDGRGEDDLLHLVVEIKGYRREDAKEKKAAMDTYWVPTLEDVPGQPRDPWDAGPTDLHRRWWEARIARQKSRDYPARGGRPPPCRSSCTHISPTSRRLPCRAAQRLLGISSDWYTAYVRRTNKHKSGSALHPDGHRPGRSCSRSDVVALVPLPTLRNSGGAGGLRSTPRAWPWRWPDPASWGHGIPTTCSRIARRGGRKKPSGRRPQEHRQGQPVRDLRRARHRDYPGPGQRHPGAPDPGQGQRRGRVPS